MKFAVPYKVAKGWKSQLLEDVNAASKNIDTVRNRLAEDMGINASKHSNGLTVNEILTHPEYRKVKNEYVHKLKTLKDFNRVFFKQYKKECIEDKNTPTRKIKL